MPNTPILPAVAIALAAAVSPAAAWSGPVPPGADRREVEKAAKEILCDCGCHPQSVYECACGRAEQMWDEIGADVAAGKSGDQVIAGYVARYGERILIAPKAVGFNLVAWLAPGIALLAVGAGLVIVLRRWAGRAAPASETGGGPAAERRLDPEYVARLERDLENMP